MKKHKAVVVAAAIALGATGCEDHAELRALKEAEAQRSVALAERQVIAQNLNAYHREVDALEKELAAAKPALDRATGADTLRPHLPKGVALDVADGGGRLVLWGSGGAKALSEVAARVAEKFPSVICESAELSEPHYRLELTLPAAYAGEPENAPSPERPAFTALPKETWRSGAKSRELRKRIVETELRVRELDKVLGELSLVAEKRELLKRRLGDVNGFDRAGQVGPVLQRVLISGALQEATFRFVPARIEIDVRRGGDVALLADELKEEGQSVVLRIGPPAQLQLARPVP